VRVSVRGQAPTAVESTVASESSEASDPIELRPEEEKVEGEGMGFEVGYGSCEGGNEGRRDGRGLDF